MLGCPCKIIKPFTFVTTKKSTALRYHSIARMPFGCSCFHMKRIVLFHVVTSRHFTRRALDLQNTFFKEQKSFIWTSLKFWKSPDDKVSPKSEEKTILNKEISPTEDINLEDDKKVETFLPQSDENEMKKDWRENFSKSTIENILKGSGDAKISTEGRSPIAESDGEKLEKIIAENIILNETKKKIQNVTVSVPGIDTQVLVKDTKKESSNNIDSSNISKALDPGIIKRQTYEVNLGEPVGCTTLQEPPNVFNSETGRTASEVPFMKESSQKFFEKAKNILRKTATTKTDENERNVKVVDLGEAKGNINLNTTTRRRQTVDLNRSSTERNFITPVRAMTDFLLKPSDLEGLRKTKRRSPYENDPPITVYWRKDVEAKALDVWGSKENLLKEILKRDIERRRYQQNLFTVKRRLRDYRREQGRESEVKLEQNGLFGSSGKVVLTAVFINGANFMFKLIAWLYTGSHSMFSETIHSLADTINQLILAYGIHKSVQRADSDHPYGYTNMRYVASLISGVGIFCVGSGLSMYHGVVGLTDPSDLPSFYWAYFILAGSLASEGATLLVAFNSIRIGARKSEMSITDYVLRGQDPSVNVVLLEDAAAVVGVGFAGLCMGLSSYYQSHIPDAIGSFLVGGLLASVASFIIYTNVAALVGRSIPQERLDKINAVLESDVMIRAIHDVKGIDIGNSLVRYKAEMDFDGGELTRSYLDKQDLNQLLEEVRKMQTIDELEEFMLKHGENIVDMLGGEIDRIELKLRVKCPSLDYKLTENQKLMNACKENLPEVFLDFQQILAILQGVGLPALFLE